MTADVGSAILRGWLAWAAVMFVACGTWAWATRDRS